MELRNGCVHRDAVPALECGGFFVFYIRIWHFGQRKKPAGEYFEVRMKTKHRRDRRKRVIHYLTEDGLVACNPRDREAAHRAEFEHIATVDPQAVTCKKCLAAMRRSSTRRISK
jgi:hypothetical protein